MEDFIQHFGVKGMKWGVRKNRSSSGGTSRIKKKLQIKPWKDLDEKEKQKRVMKVVAALLVADWAQTNIRRYTHPSVRAHNKKVVENKAKKAAYGFTKSVMERQKEKARREATIKLMANAKSGVSEAIKYLDLEFKN
jgi:hypothetical protein